MARQAYDDLVAFGATPEEIAKLGLEVEGTYAERHITVEPENAAAVRLFLRLQNSWKVESLSVGRRAFLVHTGLDLSALPVVAGALGIAVDGTILDQLGVMEREQLRIRDSRLQQSLRAP